MIAKVLLFLNSCKGPRRLRAASILDHYPENVRKVVPQNMHCRVEPRCGSVRVRWLIHQFPNGPQSNSHDHFPLAPSSNRKSGFPRYGSPTTFPMGLSATVVVCLISSIHKIGFSCGKNHADRGTFTPIAIRNKCLSWNATVQVKTEMHFGFYFARRSFSA